MRGSGRDAFRVHIFIESRDSLLKSIGTTPRSTDPRITLLSDRDEFSLFELLRDSPAEIHEGAERVILAELRFKQSRKRPRIFTSVAGVEFTTQITDPTGIKVP
jgi:hypothetical protein